MNKKMITMVAMLSAALFSWGETVLSTASSAPVRANTTFVDGSSISSTLIIDYGSFDWDEECVVTLNGTIMLFPSVKRGGWTWQPRKIGVNTLVWSSAGVAITTKVNVAALSFAVTPTPNPPMSKVSTISITPTTRNFGVGGGGNAILTSGSGTWTAAVSEPWLTLSSTSGAVGTPVAYTVSATTNIGQRVGYVYVSGHVHTVTQDGYEATVSPMEITAEKDGKKGKITLDSPGRYAWDARPNNDWISISPTHGVASGTLSYQVFPYNEVSTRSGSFTVGGKTVNVFQYGRRMKLSQYSSSHDYFAHTIALTVNALAITTWSVTPNASWISVVDAGNGRGGDTVGLAIGENPSWKARTGTVTIGTETYTITQQGRTALEFKLNPMTATASAAGGNGLMTVTATPDLPWTAKSSANWLTVLGNFVNGAGNGNVVYNASPNSTLSQRTGKITVTPGDGSLNAKTLTVTQTAATSSIDKSGYEFEAAGESVAVEVTVNDIVEWTVSESFDWISVAGSTSRVGPGSVTISASANNTIYPRSGTVTIAGKTFAVSQKARGVEVEYDSKVFGTDGGMDSISIHPDGNVSWTAVPSASWIVIFQNASGTGDAEIEYILAPYEGDGSPRTGWITIGDKKVYITQRAYDLDITPRAAQVAYNNGAGEIGVSASINDVWQAIICNADWISIVTGYDAGTGSGTVRFTYTENNTGKTRTGKILISGEEYTLTQAARTLVSVTTSVDGHGGTVSGGGTYTLGDTVTLIATPDSGYEFLYWTGSAGETMQNPLRISADVAKSYTAHFGPLTPEFTSVTTSTEGVTLAWSGLAWATQYKIYRAPTSEFPTEALVTLEAGAGCTYKDTTGDVGKSYFYWVEAIGANDTTECKDAASGMKETPIVWSGISYANLKGATHSNPSTYQEGTSVAFTVPGAVTGYTFARWEPAAITSAMTGNQTVLAVWTANGYSLVFHANGGSGTMANLAMTYDAEASVTSNGFVRSGYAFRGWATEQEGPVVYSDGATVSNLTAQAGGMVELYAVWELTGMPDPVIAPADGSSFTGDSCMVTITCPFDGATIYFTTNGANPKTSDKYKYTGAFTIAETTTIKAVAAYGTAKSSLVTATVTKRVLTLADAVDAGLTFTTGGDATWMPVLDATAKVGDASAVSGTISDEQSSWIETTVSGAGTFSFWWKTNCEWDEYGEATWDHLVVYTNGVEVARVDGSTDWEQLVFDFGSGTHVIRWAYEKDYSESDGEDCAWIDGVVWTPSGASAEPIPDLGDTPSAADVTNAVAAATDPQVKAKIDAANYNDFRDWAGRVKTAGGADAGAQGVMNADTAWLSYALGQGTLLSVAPTDADLSVEAFEPTADAGKFDFTVSVKDIEVGSEAAKENLKKVFGLEGAATLDNAAFSSDKVDIEFGTPVDGKVKFTATPKDASSGAFFMKVKMLP